MRASACSRRRRRQSRRTRAGGSGPYTKMLAATAKSATASSRKPASVSDTGSAHGDERGQAVDELHGDEPEDDHGQGDGQDDLHWRFPSKSVRSVRQSQSTRVYGSRPAVSNLLVRNLPGRRARTRVGARVTKTSSACPDVAGSEGGRARQGT